MHKKIQVNQKKIKGGCQSGRKVVPHDSKSDLPLDKAVRRTLLCRFEQNCNKEASVILL